MIKTRTATLQVKGGVVVAKLAPGLKQTIEDATENLASAVQLARPSKKPILIDIREGEPLEAHVRHYYTGKILVDSFLALAMLVNANPVGIMTGNIYFRVAKPGIPTRLFTDEDEAMKWLSKALNE